jgi:hypothetical protein
MAGPPELFNFVTKFVSLWHLGRDAQLFASTCDGQATVKLHLHLGHCPPAPQHQQPAPRRSGPSRVRRRARRAAAAVKAAAAPVTPTVEAAVKAVDDSQETAVEAVLPALSLIGHAGQADLPPQHVPAPQAHQVGHHPDPAAAQVAPQQLPSLPAEQAQPLPAPSHVRDAFCTDKHYRSAAQAAPPPQYDVRNVIHQTIPQLDGFMPPNLPDHEWSCKCCRYETFFHTEDQLEHHHDHAHMVTYEECNICFTRHVWT